MGMKKEDAISLLNKMKDIKKDSIEILSDPRRYLDEEVHWDFIGRQENSGDIVFHNDAVVMMHFEEKGTGLSGLIQKYGDPNQVWAFKETGEGVTLYIMFMYPQKGICYEHLPMWPFFSPSIDTYTVNRSTVIRDIYYFDPSVSMDKYSIGCIFPFDKSLIQPWSGYGHYKLYLYSY